MATPFLPVFAVYLQKTKRNPCAVEQSGEHCRIRAASTAPGLEIDIRRPQPSVTEIYLLLVGKYRFARPDKIVRGCRQHRQFLQIRPIVLDLGGDNLIEQGVLVVGKKMKREQSDTDCPRENAQKERSKR